MEQEWVCGIDMGSLSTLSYVAWLNRNREFLLDLYVPDVENPLPPFGSSGSVVSYAIDAPQGLPSRGNNIRVCDEQANTPTRRLPEDRKTLATWKLYGSLIRCGVTVFWSIVRDKKASIFGLDGPSNWPIVMETYPRKTAKQLGLFPLPSKLKKPFAYVDHIWTFLQAQGYRCESVVRPCVDHVDAMLCAIAAEATTKGSGEIALFGRQPYVDEEESLLREGFIVCPQRPKV